MPTQSPPDIFSVLPDWRGLSVLIIGNHPAVEDDLAAAPPCDIRIACNAAIRFPHDFAMAFDLACPKQAWWPAICALPPNSLILGIELHQSMLYSPYLILNNTRGLQEIQSLRTQPRGRAPEPTPSIFATFASRPVLTDTTTALTVGLLRGGATIAGCAIQLALHARASSLHLAGIRCDTPLHQHALPRLRNLLALAPGARRA